MFKLKYLWSYIKGDYSKLLSNVHKKIAELERRKIDHPEQESYCQSLINSFTEQIREIERKIEEKAKNN